jgi:hypothetical protein
MRLVALKRPIDEAFGRKSFSPKATANAYVPDASTYIPQLVA